ncbi:MAG: hypothetical protein HY078_10585 [Elusimicrobia bacterium]|nr:hypothetical protein [Elusimicrobiota bacterium]
MKTSKLLLACCLALGAAFVLTGRVSASAWSDFWKSLSDGSARSGKSNSKSADTVAGVRGWDKDSAVKNTAARDFNALQRLERVHLTDAEVEDFVKAGKLGD